METKKTINPLAEVAVLASLSICLPTKVKGSKQNTSTLIDTTGAKNAKQVGAFIRPFESRMKVIHRVKHALIDHTWGTLTLPWSTGRGGARLVPNGNITALVTATREAFAELERLRDEFIRDYDYLLGEEQELKRGGFHRDDYPSKEEMAAKFDWSMSFDTVPAAELTSDLRVKASADAVSIVEAELKKRADERAAELLADVHRRIDDTVGHMARHLKAVEASGEGKIFDSLVGNVRDLANILPALNVLGDPTLDAAAAAMQKLCDGLHVDDLKYNAAVRSRVIDEATAIARAVSIDGADTAAQVAAPQMDDKAAAVAKALDDLY